MSYKEIGVRLHISESTVGFHQIAIYRALGVHTSMDLAKSLIRANVVTLDTWLGDCPQ